MKYKVYFTAIFFLLTISIFSQTTYYVSSSDGSDSNSGKSSSSPWKNLSKLNSSKFYPGDKILLKKGDTWIGQWSLNYSGTSSNPILIGSYGSGATPILSGNKSLMYLIRLYNDVHDVTIEGLFFKDCDPDGPNGTAGLIYGSSNNKNITIKNCIFQQNLASNNSNFGLIYMKDPSYLTIDGCDLSGKSQGIHLRSNYGNHRDVHHIIINNNNFHDIVDWAFGRAIRFSSDYTSGIGTTLGQEGIIRDVTISNNNFTKIGSIAIFHEDAQNSSGTAIWLEAGETSYNIKIINNTGYLIEWGFIDWGRITDRDGKFGWSYVSGNNIDHCGFDINGNETTRYPTNVINTHAWKDVYIEDNKISTVGTNSGDGKAIILDHSTSINTSGIRTVYECDGVVVRRNIVSGCRYSSSGYAGGIHIYDAKNCKIYNNVSFNNQTGITVEGKRSVNNLVYNNTCDGNDAGFWFGSPTTGNIIENNIFSNNKNYGIKYNSNLVYDYNLFYNNGKNYSSGSSGTHDVNGDPKYKNISSRDYELTSSSAAIDKGVSISGLVTDILGNSIINKVDIGAYQYSTSSSSSLPSIPSLNTPSNGSTSVSTNPILNWNSSSNADSYSLQVSENSNFSSYVYNQGGLSSTSKQLSNLSEDTKYYWRANAKNSSGTSSWSTIFSFTTLSNNPQSTGVTSINAQNGILSGDVHLKTKSGSINSKVLYFLNTYSTAKYSITLDKSGTVYAWGRMFFESTSTLNSFYIQVDNGQKLIFGNNFTFDKWHWEGKNLAALSLGNLSSGSHTITIYGREPAASVMLDQIILTSDASYNPNNSSSEGSSNNNVLISAESGSLSGDVHLKTKSGSINSKVLYFLNTYSTAKYSITLDKSGTVYAWGRMFFESTSTLNSFYIQVDNGPKLTFGNSNNNFDKWHWEGFGVSPLELGNLSSGSHTITIYGREPAASVMLDQIILTSDASYNPNNSSSEGSSNNNVLISAESGSLSGDVHLKTKSGSINSKVLYFLNTYSTAKYSITLDKSGTVYAWGRMFFESTSTLNSFFIQVDNGPKLILGNSNNNFDKWHWEGFGVSPLELGNLSSGSHTITIYGREPAASVMLDEIYFTYDPNFIANDNNVTIAKSDNSINNNNLDIEKPENYQLSQNFPNPFNPTTTIKFSIPQDGMVSLKVYNILGAEVVSLIDEEKSAGTYNVLFDASNLASGIYLYKLITPNFIQTKKMLLVK